MNNMSKHIKEHNKRVTLKRRDQLPKCNCRKKAKWATEMNCELNNVVYKCDVTKLLPKKVYRALAEREWKSRFCNHKFSFKHKRQHFQVTCGT